MRTRLPDPTSFVVDGIYQDGTDMVIDPDNVGTDSVDVLANTVITNDTASDVGLSIKGAVSQTANLQTWSENDGAVVAQVQGNGRIYTTSGVKADALTGGGSLMLWPDGGIVIEHDLQAHEADFDYTGGSQENLMTDAAGVFVAADEGNWIIVRTGTYKGAMAEIKTFIDSDNVVLHTMGWDFDIADFGYYIIQHPQVVIGDGYHNEFQVGTTGHLDIHSDDWVGSTYSSNMFEVEMDGAAANLRTAHIESECNGYNNIVGLEVHAKSGDLGPDKSVAGIYSHIDVSEATSSDATTSTPCYIAGVENGTSATTKAFLALAGFSKAFQVYGAPDDDPRYGYEVTGGVVADRVNGGTADTTAFLSSSASDLEIMDSDDDYILIGSDNTFEIVDVDLSTGANTTIVPLFYYSKAGGNWTALTVVDTTNGLTDNGQFNFNAPSDWTKDDEAEANGDITNAYYIKVVRTRNNLVQNPVENYFKTRASKSSGMEIRGDGVVKLPYVGGAPSDLENGMIWMESDGLHIYAGDSESILS